ncbi:MAG: hypothetical protein PHR81_01465 [Bacteroidales bacterium]|jgi:hypothetical protein|nr:hypothetical protein [Bacteroidales bacterium]
MKELFAKIISLVFHPNLIPIYALLFIFNINTYVSIILPFTAKMLLFFIFFFSTVVIPFVIYLILKRKQIIANMYMENKEDRIYPYLVNSLIYYIVYRMLLSTHLPGIYSTLLLGSCIISIIILILNFKIKISVHMAGAGGLTGFFAGFSNIMNLNLLLPVCGTIFLSGIIAYARMKLKSHTSTEIYFGYLIGLSVFLILTLFKIN